MLLTLTTKSLSRLVLGAIIVWMALPLFATAASSRVNVSQGYRTAEHVVEGSLVATDSKSSGTVVLATSANVANLVGVVVQTDESLLSIQSDANQTQVATSGSAYALVGNSNGEIKAGDRITASATPGVGMKATSSARILGVAQSNFDTAVGVQTISSKDAKGKTVELKVGRLLVQIDVNYYSAQTDIGRTVIPQSLQSISDSVAGKPVPTLRIILSLLLLVFALVIAAILVNGAVKSSIISIGRNPLSSQAVRGGLLKVVGLVFIILLVTLISVYLLLSR